MKTQIGKWGNSLAMRFPRALVERHGLKEGDPVDVDLIDKALEQMQSIALQERRDAALEEIRRRRFPLPKDFKFNREEANARPSLDKW
jgi:antitoxin MazE